MVHESFSISMLWSTRSNALRKSRNTAPTYFPSSTSFNQLSIRLIKINRISCSICFRTIQSYLGSIFINQGFRKLGLWYFQRKLIISNLYHVYQYGLGRFPLKGEKHWEYCTVYQNRRQSPSLNKHKHVGFMSICGISDF